MLSQKKLLAFDILRTFFIYIRLLIVFYFNYKAWSARTENNNSQRLLSGIYIIVPCSNTQVEVVTKVVVATNK